MSTSDSDLPPSRRPCNGGDGGADSIRDDVVANEAAMARVRADKFREASAGHDGTWIAHPGLAAIAREPFDAIMRGPNQKQVLREDVRISASDLLAVPEGSITEAGLRACIRIGIQYLESWLRGVGCVPLYNQMEDAATAEICQRSCGSACGTKRIQRWTGAHRRLL